MPYNLLLFRQRISLRLPKPTGILPKYPPDFCRKSPGIQPENSQYWMGFCKKSSGILLKYFLKFLSPKTFLDSAQYILRFIGCLSIYCGFAKNLPRFCSRIQQDSAQESPGPKNNWLTAQEFLEILTNNPLAFSPRVSQDSARKSPGILLKNSMGFLQKSPEILPKNPLRFA